jgi:hypothetical protein
VGEPVDELMNGAGVLQLRLAGSQEDGFTFVAESDGAEGGGARLRRSYRRGADCRREEGRRRIVVEVGREGLRGRFYYEGQCHMPLRFSLLVARTGAGWFRLRFRVQVVSPGLAAVVAAFAGGLPGDWGKGALKEGVVDDVAFAVFALDDPVAGIGFALAGVGEDYRWVEALGGVYEKRSAGAERVHVTLSWRLCSADMIYFST